MIRSGFSWVRPAVTTFCGRDHLLRDLRRRLHRKESIALRGARRLGKTSLLLELHRQFRSDLANAAAGPHVVSCFIDFREARIDNLTNFITDMESLCRRELYEVTHTDFLGSLREMATRLKIELNWRLLLLIDEAERLGRVPEYRDILDYLCTLAFPSDQTLNEVQLLAVGGFGLWDLLSEDSTSSIATRMTWQVLGQLESAVMPFPDEKSNLSLLDSGFLVPVIYQYMMENFEIAETMDPSAVLQKFACEARSVLLSWWKSLSRMGRTLLLREVSAGLGGDLLRDNLGNVEIRERLMGTGLIKGESSYFLSAPQLWRLLAQVGPTLLDETSEESEPLSIRVRRGVEDFENLIRSLVEEEERRQGSEEFENLLRGVLREREVNTVVKRAKYAMERYPLSRGVVKEPICRFLSFRELVAVITDDRVWNQLMSNDFRADLIREAQVLAVVRDDFAHPRQIPEKELMRALVSADDMIMLLQEKRIPPRD